MSGAQEFERVLDGSDKNVASFERNDVSLLKRVQHFLHSTPAAVPLIVLVLAIVIFGIAIGGKFFSAYTLTLILQQIAIVGILGAAQTLVILTAGIDLSIGVIMVISSVVMGNVAVTYGLPTPIAIVAGMIVGGLCGLLNGFLVANMKLPPFIVTLGTWNIVMATNFIYSANETIRDTDVDEQAPLLHLFAASFRVGGAVLTLGVIAMVLLVVGLWYVLNHTAWGRHVYAVGGNARAALLSGVRVGRVKSWVYVISGICAALVGLIVASDLVSAHPASGETFELSAIAAVVLGGASLAGGRGTIGGTIIGACVIDTLGDCMVMMGVSEFWQMVIKGTVIVAAVILDQLQTRMIGGKS